MWLIYKHTSKTSGKSYIGLTKAGINKRWIQHTSDARNGSKLYFHNAIRLYGEDDWVHEILESNISTLEEANARELEYIKMYNTFEEGYNLTIGGDGAPGVKWTQEKADMIDSKKPVYKFIHYEYGIEELTLSKMCKKYNMSKGTLHGLINGTKESYYGWQMYSVVGDNPKNMKKDTTIHTFYHQSGIIEECTAKELSVKYNVKYSKINRMLNGHSKFVKGWTLKQYDLSYRHNSKKSIIRTWYNTETKVVEKLSTSAMCRKYGLSNGSLTSVAKGRRNHHKNWIIADAEMKLAKAVEHKAKAQEHLASAELKQEQADNLAVEFVKETTGQKRREHEMDKEYEAAVKLAEKKDNSKVQ